MKRAHRIPSRLIRLSGVCVSLALVLSTVSFSFPVSGGRSSIGGSQETRVNERRVNPLPPRTGPPAPNLPNLDEVRTRPQAAPQAPPADTFHLSQPYLNARIIGLVSSSKLYDSIAGQWQAKTTYEYDSTAIDAQGTAATMHDQSYSASFTTRGNVTSVSRWDVTDIDNASKALTSTMSYNATGSVLSSTDPATHTQTISYVDSFSDGINRNTFAYPTTVTNADGFNSTIQYNYDFGAKTRVEGPPPQGQPNGIIQTFAYDSGWRAAVNGGPATT